MLKATVHPTGSEAYVGPEEGAELSAAPLPTQSAPIASAVVANTPALPPQSALVATVVGCSTGAGMAGQFLPVLQGTVVSTCFTADRMIKDEQAEFYTNPNYGVARFDKKLTKGGSERRQLIVEKSGAKERLRHFKSNAKDKAETKRDYEQWANVMFVLAELVLYVILGWAATQVVKYQEKYGEEEWETALCFAEFSTPAPTPAPARRLTGENLTTPTLAPTLAPSVLTNATASFLFDDEAVCGVHALNIGGMLCTESAEPPDFGALPDQNLVYAAAVIYTFLKLFNAFATFFSTKFEGEWLFKVHGVYYHAEKLVEDFADSLFEGRTPTPDQVDAVNELRLPELVPKARDDSLTCVGIFLFACVCGGNWLISRSDVVLGLILIVLSSMGIAIVIKMHVQSMREITYLTWCVPRRARETARRRVARCASCLSIRVDVADVEN